MTTSIHVQMPATGNKSRHRRFNLELWHNGKPKVLKAVFAHSVQSAARALKEQYFMLEGAEVFEVRESRMNNEIIHYL